MSGEIEKEEKDDEVISKDANEMAAMVAKFLAKHQGEPSKAVEQLLTDNYELRNEKREIKKRPASALAELRAKAIPEGKRLLTDDEEKVLKKIEELGGPDKLGEILARTKELEDKEAERSWTETADSIAKKAGFNPAVFRTLLKADGLDPKEAFEVKGDDPNVRIEVKTGEGKVPLAKYAENKWADHLPSLKAVERGRGKPASLLQQAAEQSRQGPPLRTIPTIP